MDLQNLNFFTSQEIISIFFKIFAIIFSVFYLLYSIVISKQSEVMNKTLEVKDKHIFAIVSSTQITIGLILIILAILLV